MLELYEGKIRDLLYEEKTGNANEKNANPNKPLNFVFGSDKTQGYVQGQNFKPVTSFDQCMKLMDLGTSRRKVSSTLLNNESSRSHCVYHLQLWNGPTAQVQSDEDNANCFANMSIIDLAGAERSAKTGAQAGSTTQSETNSINSSLMRLHDLIAGSRNYRNDILTKIVSRYFAGTAKVSIICNINPSVAEYEETVASLRWASLASKAKQQSLIQGQSGAGALQGGKTVQSLIAENEMLKAQIQQHMFNNYSHVPSPQFQQQHQIQVHNQQQIKALEDQLMEKFVFVQRAAKAKLEQEYCDFMIKDFATSHSSCFDVWNANSGKNDSFDGILEDLEKRVAGKYYSQITILREKNEKLLNEVEEQDKLIETLQSKGMDYYRGYCDLYGKLDLIRDKMNSIQSNHDKSCEEMTTCQERWKIHETAFATRCINKLVEPYADAYSILINQYQSLETQLTALLQVNAEAEENATKLKVTASTRKPRTAPAPTTAPTTATTTDIPSTPSTRSNRTRNATNNNDEIFSTPIQPTKATTKTIKKLKTLQENTNEDKDVEDDNNTNDNDETDDLFDQDEEEKPVPRTRKALAAKTVRAAATTAATTTPALRARPTRAATAAGKVRNSSQISVSIEDEPTETRVTKQQRLTKKGTSKLNTEVVLSSSSAAAAPAAANKAITTPGPETRSQRVKGYK